MKVFKKLSLVALSFLTLFSIGLSTDNVSANSQTNKLPRVMRNKWYGNIQKNGLKYIKLYGNPVIYNGSNYIHINRIKRYGYKYDLMCNDADPLEVWYHHGHLSGVESGTASIHLYAHNKRHAIKHHARRIKRVHKNLHLTRREKVQLQARRAAKRAMIAAKKSLRHK